MAGLLLVPLLVIAVLSLRPGGLRRQLSLAGRRFRILLTLAGAYFVCAAIIRLAFPSGPVSDYGPPVVAVVREGRVLLDCRTLTDDQCLLISR